MHESEAEIKKLQRHLKEVEEKNKVLLLKNKQLIKDLEIKSTELEAIHKNKQRVDQDKATCILNTIFTPGQVQKLTMPNNKKIKWSAEDISSAIAL